MKTLYKFALSLALIVSFAGFTFAQTERGQGIELYRKADYKAAIAALRNSNEAEDLYYLGLAYEKSGQTGKAKDAFKKSFTESYDVFFKKFEEWQKIYNDDSKQNFADFLQQVKANNAVGFAAAEKAFSLKSEIFQTNEWRVKAKVLSDTTALAKKQTKIYSISDKPITAVKILEKPFAPSPKDNRGVPFARRNERQDQTITVTLFIIYGTDGEFKLMMPVDKVFDAFTVEVLKAAGKIKFEPASKDNKPVFYRSKIQYSFSFR